MRNKKWCISICSIIGVGVFAASYIFSISNVEATVSGGSQDFTTTGCTGTWHENADGSITPDNAVAGYNCCGGVRNTSCPKWIKGTSEQFTIAANNREGSGYDLQKMEVCKKSSGTVWWFGNVKDARHGMQLSLRNFRDSLAQENLSDPYVVYDARTGAYSALSEGEYDMLFNYATSIGLEDTIDLAFACDELNCTGNDCPETPPPPENKPEETQGCGLSGNVTDVVAKIRVVNSETGDVSDWKVGNSTSTGTDTSAFVWAKPNDIIQVQDCYYSGLQNYYGTDVYSYKDPLHGTNPIQPYNYNLDAAQGRSTRGITETTIQERYGWQTNGYETSGFVGDNKTEYDAAAKAKEYVYTYQMTVSPTSNLGNGNLNNNWQQIKSRFKDAIKTISFPAHNIEPTWSCNTYRHKVTDSYSETAPSGTTSPSCNAGYSMIKQSTKCYPTETDCQFKVTTSWQCTRTYYVDLDSTCFTNDLTTSRDAAFNGADTAIASTYFKVPYNYVNHGGSGISSDVIYTGETVEIFGGVQTDSRYNATTGGTYATRVPNARWITAGYISDNASGTGPNMPNENGCPANSQCAIYSEMTGSGSLNDEGDYSTAWKSLGVHTVNVWDVDAGKYFCVKTMVYPAESNGDTDMDGNGRGWASNNASCKVISKKPTFQVYGGSIYVDSGSVVQNYSALKNNVAGDRTGFSYNRNGIDNSGNIRKFYSWSDQGLIVGSSLQTYKNFATGAAANLFYGTASSAGGILANQGAIESTMRTYQPLTMPSMSISSSSGAVNFAGVGASLSTSFRQTVSKIVEKESTTICNIDSTVKLNKGQDNIFYCNGTMTISGNIEYAGTYGSSADVPMAIIYAKNINIMPNVTRIDGWIIAEDTIDTCANASNACNNPLTIRGTVSATKLRLNRTYGAESGTRSSEPAELFIYSASALINSRSGAESSSDNLLQTVYTRELAPRY